MANFLGTSDCTRWTIEIWKEWHVTKIITLCSGVAMTIAGFYNGFTLSFSEYGPWIISSLFVGVAGFFIVAYFVTVFLLNVLEETERNGSNGRNSSPTRSNVFSLYSNTSVNQSPYNVQINPSTSLGVYNEANTATVRL